MSHGLGCGSCEIVDELDDFNELPHPNTLFSQLWKDDTLQKSRKTSGESLSADATKFSMPDLVRQNGQREFLQKYASEAKAKAGARDSFQADGINGISSSLGESFINIYDGGRLYGKESVQERIDCAVPFFRNDWDVGWLGKEDNRASKCHKDNKSDSKPLVLLLP